MAQKYTYCPHCSQPLEDDGSCSGCTYGHKRNQPTHGKTINPECTWNDHGIRCGKIGSMSESTNGQGPWYCAAHYWQLKGWPIKKSNAPKMNYRERWYIEHNLPYQPPNLDGTPTFKAVASSGTGLNARLLAGNLGPKHQRQPGDDDEQIAV